MGGRLLATGLPRSEPTGKNLMSEPKRDDEPTMEEILASIRKIISEDDPESGGEAKAAPAEAAPQDVGNTGDSDEPEPMELTQMVSDDGTVVDLRADQPASAAPIVEASRPEAADPLVPEDTRVHADVVAEEVDVTDPEAQGSDPGAGEAESEADEGIEAVPLVSGTSEAVTESLVSAEASTAATASLSRLSDSLAAGKALSVGQIGDKTLEVLVQESMAPHLKSWLDKNLPDLVERIVREEIEKMVKRVEDR